MASFYAAGGQCRGTEYTVLSTQYPRPRPSSLIPHPSPLLRQNRDIIPVTILAPPGQSAAGAVAHVQRDGLPRVLREVNANRFPLVVNVAADRLLLAFHGHRQPPIGPF